MVHDLYVELGYQASLNITTIWQIQTKRIANLDTLYREYLQTFLNKEKLNIEQIWAVPYFSYSDGTDGRVGAVVSKLLKDDNVALGLITGEISSSCS